MASALEEIESGSSGPERAAEVAAAEPAVAAAVLEKIEALIEAGQEVEKDAQFAVDAKLPVAREVRLRRKSKDLATECLELMGASLESTFNAFDKDGSGTIDFDEYVRVLISYCMYTKEDILKCKSGRPGLIAAAGICICDPPEFSPRRAARSLSK